MLNQPCHKRIPAAAVPSRQPRRLVPSAVPTPVLITPPRPTTRRLPVSSHPFTPSHPTPSAVPSHHTSVPSRPVSGPIPPRQPSRPVPSAVPSHLVTPSPPSYRRECGRRDPTVPTRTCSLGRAPAAAWRAECGRYAAGRRPVTPSADRRSPAAAARAPAPESESENTEQRW